MFNTVTKCCIFYGIIYCIISFDLLHRAAWVPFLPSIYTVPLLSQGDGKPVTGNLPGDTSLLSRSEPAWTCKSHAPVKKSTYIVAKSINRYRTQSLLILCGTSDVFQLHVVDWRSIRRCWNILRIQNDSASKLIYFIHTLYVNLR